jgi:hypothetical protein
MFRRDRERPSCRCFRQASGSAGRHARVAATGLLSRTVSSCSTFALAVLGCPVDRRLGVGHESACPSRRNKPLALCPHGDQQQGVVTQPVDRGCVNCGPCQAASTSAHARRRHPRQQREGSAIEPVGVRLREGRDRCGNSRQRGQRLLQRDQLQVQLTTKSTLKRNSTPSTGTAAGPVAGGSSSALPRVLGIRNERRDLANAEIADAEDQQALRAPRPRRPG